MFSKGIMLIEDIVDEAGDLRVMDGISWLNARQIFNAIPGEWIRIIKGVNENVNSVKQYIPMYNKLRNDPKAARSAYAMLIDDCNATLKYYQRWQSIGINLELEMYYKCFDRIYRVTVVKLRDFQYRLMLNKLVTNLVLMEWGLRDNANCSFCGIVEETVVHILYSCSEIGPIINFFYELCSDENADYSIEAFLFNYVIKKEMHVINYISLFIKQYLYKCRCMKNKPKLQQVMSELRNQYLRDTFNARINNHIGKHNNKWRPMLNKLIFVSLDQ